MKLFFSLFLSASFFFLPGVSHAQTEFGKGAEEYKELYDNVRKMLLSAYDVQAKLNDADRNQFVRLIRDHIHVMKAAKVEKIEDSSYVIVPLLGAGQQGVVTYR